MYTMDGNETWSDKPGLKMEKLETGEFRGMLTAKSVVFAFNNGGEFWDNKDNMNYRTGLPGKYRVRDGQVHALGVATADDEKNAVAAR